MVTRTYSVFLLTQEKAEHNGCDAYCAIDHREVMNCCPSFGSFTFTSNSETQTGVLRDFKDWLGNQTMDDLYSRMSFPNWKEEIGRTVLG